MLSVRARARYQHVNRVDAATIVPVQAKDETNWARLSFPELDVVFLMSLDACEVTVIAESHDEISRFASVMVRHVAETTASIE